MSKTKSGSKRQALRFKGSNYPIRFKTEFEDGNGLLANISASGCALHGVTLPLTTQEKILIMLDLEEGGSTIEIGGRVVRTDENGAAVRFIIIGEPEKKRIVQFFAANQRST